MSFLTVFDGIEVEKFSPTSDDTLFKNASTLNIKLHYANTPEIVNIILLKGVDVNNINSFGETPLHSALMAGRELGVIKALLCAGADVKAVDLKGRTPLHSAIIYGRELPVIKALLYAGANVNAQESYSQFTPLHFAQTEEVVSELIWHGANVNALSMSDGTPLLFGTFAKKSVGVIKALLSAGADVNCKVKYYLNTPLHYAHTEEIVNELLSHGANVNALDLLKRSPLHSALIAGRELPVIKALLAAGADVNAKVGCSQFTVLHFANSEEIVYELLMHGAHINAPDMFGGTPLHFGTFANKDLSVIKALLSNGADVNCKVKYYQYTPLYYANTEEITKELLLYGADVKASGFDNKTPLHSAVIDCRELCIIKAILCNGADVNAELACNKCTALHYADTGDIVNELICNGADTNVLNSDGETPLHLAIRANKDISVIKALLSGGADPNALSSVKPIRTVYNIGYEQLFQGSDVNGETPLVSALYSKAKPEVIKLLLSAGAKVKGHTVFHKCLCPETASLLLLYGADVNERDDKLNTALHTLINSVPVSKKALNVIRLLLKAGLETNARNALGEQAIQYAEVIHQEGERKLKLLIDLLYYGLKHRFILDIHHMEMTRLAKHFFKMLILTHHDYYKSFLAYNSEPCCDSSSCLCSQWVKFFEKCDQEVVLLKKYRIYNNFSLFNLIIEKPIKPLFFSLRLARVVSMFSIYKGILTKALRESSERALLRFMFNNLRVCCLSERSGNLVILSFECMNIIANYLNDHEKLKLITAMSRSAHINLTNIFS